MPAPSLPELPPDLHWLITMEPTLPNLDDYIERRASTGRRSREGGQAFRVSHIFTVTDTLSWYQNHYRLDPAHDGRGILAGVGGHELHIPDVEAELRVLRASHVTEEGIAEYRQYYADLSAAIDQLCRIIADQWYEAFRVYDNPRGYMGSLNELLYLEPSISRPDRSLIDDLCKPAGASPGSRSAWYLLLLTARHELGHAYLKTQDWLKHSLEERGDSALEEGDWDRLTARLHRIPIWENRQVLNSRQRTVLLAKLQYRGSSDLAELYHAIGEWVRNVQRAALNVQECARPGCHRPVRGRYGGGAKKAGTKSKFCDLHTTSRRYVASSE